MFAGGTWEACIKRLQGEAQWHDPHIFCPDPFAANLKILEVLILKSRDSQEYVLIYC